MSSRKQLESLTLGNLRNELRRGNTYSYDQS